MERSRRRIRTRAGLAAAAAWLACGGEEVRTAPAEDAAGLVGEATVAEEGALGADPELAAEVLSPSVVSAPQAPPLDPEHVVPLDSLLRAPAQKPPPRMLDLRVLPEESAPAPEKPRGVTDAVRERMRVERRSEPIGRGGPDQGTYSETEAGVDVPVGERVKLRGGVRVEERDEPAGERVERESTPRVGVEVEF